MEFKGTKEDWYCVFTMDKKRAVRTKGGIICILTKPSRYSGQDERYDQELSVNQADQKLIASAPKLLEALQEFVLMIESEEITIQTNFDNDGFENAGSRIYEQSKQAIKQALG